MQEDNDELFTPHELLADARRDFAGYYESATPADAMLLDGLVMAHAALVVGYNSLVTETDPGIRGELERNCVKAEQVFSGFRERVRRCPTFSALSPGEQVAIHRVVFTVQVPEL